MTTWDSAFEATPADSDAANLGAGKIRELKTAIRERFGGLPWAINPSYGGSLYGLTLSPNADTTKLDVAAGVCRDSTNAADIVLSSAITAGQLATGAWVAGNTQVKLDTGTVANGVYHVFAIRKDSDGSGDFLFSTSPTAPTMPAGYTYKRCIGSVIRSGGTIVPFSQFGDEFLLKTPTTLWSATALSTTNTLYTTAAPTGRKVKVLIRGGVVTTVDGRRTLIYSPDMDVATATDANMNVGGSVTAGSFSFDLAIRTDTSARIQAVADGAVDLYGVTYGWIDRRGQDA